MIRRDAITLVEVLISIFIMGVGLLALLTLFPLGALTMDQAIKADRAAISARNIYGITTTLNLRRDPAYYNFGVLPPIDVFTDPNPAGAAPPPWPIISRQPGAHRGPTYPVYVDTFGVLATGTPQPLGALPGSPGIPRSSVSMVLNAPTAQAQMQQALRWFSLLDDIEFDDDGLPRAIGGQVQRSNRYTWALMLKRVSAAERDWVEMAVVVYHNRPLQSAVNEPVYGPVLFDPNDNVVHLEWDPATQERPPIRKGGWILDATVLNAAGGPEPHGFFYRVTNVSDAPPRVPGRLAMVLDLQERPRKGTTRGVLVVMEYAIEVFDEGLGWKP